MKTDTEAPKKKLNPFKVLFRTQKANIFLAFCVGAFVTIPFYFGQVYLGGVLRESKLLTGSETLYVSTLLLVCWSLVGPIVGRIADTVGLIRIMSLGCLGTACLVYPLLWHMNDDLSLQSIITAQLGIILIGLFTAAPSAALFPSLFNKEVRVSGMAFAYSLAIAIGGTSTPLYCKALVEYTGNPNSPALYVIGMSLLCLVTLACLKKTTADKPLTTP